MHENTSMRCEPIGVGNDRLRVGVERLHGVGPRARWRITCFAVVVALGFTPRPSSAALSMGGIVAHSPDDISGFTTLSGDDNTASVTLPFTFTVEGAAFTTIVLSTNGWIEFGANTSGSSDNTNTCLPTGNHTNPFLAAYWDDLVPFGTIVRYGTVGTAPDRTFIADYEVDLFSPPGPEGSDDLRFQIQLHERSNLITVRYRDQQSGTNGSAATIGFQGAGGAGATTVQPLTCNGKILDDNRPNEGWSADVGRAGLVTLAAVTAHSPDDISGFTALTGDNATANAVLPFSVTIEGTSYSAVAISTNGWIEFGSNTAGDSDPSNDPLPTAAHTNPLLAAYWDDLNPFGTNVRYGTVGTSPNRTFIVDFEADVAVGEGSDDLRFQVQIHERSRLISVRYRDKQNNANGQLATIGFQGAGGAAAAAYPLTFNGKILDDNDVPDEGWSVHPKTLGAMSLHSILAHSPDDISGFTTLSGDSGTASAGLGFTLNIEGTTYTTVAISTNGWMEFGGNTAGTSDPVNACLPTATHSNPFLAAYWDDMTTSSTHIRYGTVGTSPNRTFIAEFYLLTTTGADDSGADDLQFQVQVHEGSNAINVKYHFAQGVVNGQAATIGFQGAGGAGAASVHPLVCNGKILDDNRDHQGWSIAPLPVCGNSLTETKEQCDVGGANGSATSCCTSSCLFRAAGQTCRTAAGVCDLADTCTGASAGCPADAKSSAPCRGAGGVCDLAESCDGIGNDCPADAKSSALCRASGGVCDLAENCDGVGNDCPADAKSSALCRASGGVCDLAENCDGVGNDCPADAKSSAPCRAAGGVCDLAESCDGVGNDCPADAKSSAPCRAAGGVCDLADNCDGIGNNCPADAKSTAECRAVGGVCDLAESCDGIGNNCPADAKSTAECRAVGGVCDLAESCDGVGNNCPADAKSTALCRADAGECDVAESCDGVNDACPADVGEANGFPCGSAGDSDCDNPDTCDGAGSCQLNNESNGFPCGDANDTDCTDPDTCDGSASCQANHAANTTLCRAASAGQECDEAELCDGAGNCPADAVKASGTPCRVAAGVCDVQENCDGVSSDCPADAVVSNGTECRADAGQCDLAESCDGVGVNCPPDAFEASGFACGDPSTTTCTNPDTCDGLGTCLDNHETPGTECRAAGAGQECDEAEECDGAGNCPADGVKPSGTLCRPDAGECDVQEVCDGLNADCPVDALEPDLTPCGAPLNSECTDPDVCLSGACEPQDEPAGTVCRAASAGQLCDEAEECDGLGGCPVDAPKGAGVECRVASAGQACDEAEACDGVSFQCPADGVKPLGTLCRAAAGDCDIQEVCDGIGSDCPADAVESVGTICRVDAGECDLAEQCDGVGTTCPANAFEPDDTQCTDDGLFCSGTESCQGGVCSSSGDPCSSGTCDEPADECVLPSCASAPLAGCRTALKSILVVKDKMPDTKDKLIWKWLKGQTTTQAEFADPITTASYALCVYTGVAENLVAESVVPPSTTAWKEISGKGYKYKDSTGSEGGVSKIVLKGNANPDKSKALVKGKGMELPDLPPASDTALALDLPVRVQLVNEDNGTCFEADYQSGDVKKNVPGTFKAKAQ